nr:MAG TPA: hypothetical protein [Caudoviricetes sp.]
MRESHSKVCGSFFLNNQFYVFIMKRRRQS